jgi:hypothetical protein
MNKKIRTISNPKINNRRTSKRIKTTSRNLVDKRIRTTSGNLKTKGKKIINANPMTHEIETIGKTQIGKRIPINRNNSKINNLNAINHQVKTMTKISGELEIPIHRKISHMMKQSLPVIPSNYSILWKMKKKSCL